MFIGVSIDFLDLHLLESRLREEEDCMLIKAFVQVDQHTRLVLYHEGSCDPMVW